MDAKELIKAGKLAEARHELIEAVKSSPADISSRTLLFQVLAFYGEWEKARRHLELIATQDPDRAIGVQAYSNIIQAEAERLEVFQNNRRPSFLPEAPPYADRYESAWQMVGDKKFNEAEALFNQIHAERPRIAGTLNGKEFSGFKETDARLSRFLEAFVHERYVWIPFESLRELLLMPPTKLFDLLWASAQITTWKGLTLNCLLPVTYPESFRHADDQMKLGRMTDWTDLGAGFHQGVGQHVFQVGEEDIGILEIREALFNSFELEKDDESGH